jgi:hypothetical protein
MHARLQVGDRLLMGGDAPPQFATKPGTELNITQEGLPDMIPVEACYLGWQDSLQNLAKLVEPDINRE